MIKLDHLNFFVLANEPYSLLGAPTTVRFIITTQAPGISLIFFLHMNSPLEQGLFPPISFWSLIFIKLLMNYSNTGKRTRRQASPCIPNRTCYLTQTHALTTGLLCGDRRVLEPLLMILAVYICNYT